MTFWTRWNIFQRLSFCSNKLAPDRLLWYICRLGVVTAEDFIKESACLHFSICIFMQLCNCWQESSTVVFWHCCLPAGGGGGRICLPRSRSFTLSLSCSLSQVPHFLKGRSIRGRPNMLPCVHAHKKTHMHAHTNLSSSLSRDEISWATALAVWRLI